ncbi:MAG: hypothetical protein Q9214_003793 [Letrouitia sp. 1 TL-2023]
MPDLSVLLTLAPYHLISYGTLLGSSIYQSFVGGIIAFRVLPRPQFSTLQSAIFPVYFSMQTALPVLLALTYPGTKTSRSGSGLPGVLTAQNRYTVFAPLAIPLTINAANLFYISPQTTKTMKQRKHQETRDGKKSYDPPPHSKEMQRLNKTFRRLHGASALLNLASLGAILWYGVVLAERLQ